MAGRTKGKLTAIPVGAEAWFLADETGRPFRPPLPEMDELKPGQDVVLMDDDGYVLETASPDASPNADHVLTLKDAEMSETSDDHPLLARIEELVQRERRLQAQEVLSEEDLQHLNRIHTEREQMWDLVRRRRALRMSGQDPDTAEVRPATIVEQYEA